MISSEDAGRNAQPLFMKIRVWRRSELFHRNVVIWRHILAPCENLHQVMVMSTFDLGTSSFALGFQELS